MRNPERVIYLLVGVILGLLVGTTATQLTAQTSNAPNATLYGVQPTTGRRIPISVTTEGYINTKVIP